MMLIVNWVIRCFRTIHWKQKPYTCVYCLEVKLNGEETTERRNLAKERKKEKNVRDRRYNHTNQRSKQTGRESFLISCLQFQNGIQNSTRASWRKAVSGTGDFTNTYNSSALGNS